MNTKGHVVLCAVCFLFFSCASTPKQSARSGSGESVSIPLPQQKARTYFSSIPAGIMELAEDGSPESLRQLYALLHKPADEYTEPEKVLLYAAHGIMAFAWPSEPAAWDVPAVSGNDPYSGALDSARRGIYDSSTGNSDFLTILLPSLVLLSSSSRTDYFPQAEKAIDVALELRPSSVLAGYLMGVLLLKEGRAADSVAYFQKALSGAPSVYELNFALANALYRAGNYRDALAKASSLLERLPNSLPLLELCAESSYALGNLEETESYILRVLTIEPENLRYVLFRARILASRGDYIRASSLLDVYAKTDSTARDYLLLRAQLQREWNKNVTASGETISRALSLYPNDVEVLLFAAEIASDANIRVGGLSAMELADRVLALDPRNEAAARISVSELIKKEMWQEAYNVSGPLVASGNAGIEIMVDYVTICIALSRNDEAMRVASSMYKNAPRDESAQQAYIKALVRTNQRAQAVQVINSLMPSASLRMKSFLYYERSFFADTEDAALSELRSSLTSNPRNKDALFRLYEIYYNKKDWRRAQYYLKQVVALDPYNPSVLQKNAELDSLLGK